MRIVIETLSAAFPKKKRLKRERYEQRLSLEVIDSSVFSSQRRSHPEKLSNEWQFYPSNIRPNILRLLFALTRKRERENFMNETRRGTSSAKSDFHWPKKNVLHSPGQVLTASRKWKFIHAAAHTLRYQFLAQCNNKSAESKCLLSEAVVAFLSSSKRFFNSSSTSNQLYKHQQQDSSWLVARSISITK